MAVNVYSLALRKLRQEGHNFEASLGYKAGPHLKRSKMKYIVSFLRKAPCGCYGYREVWKGMSGWRKFKGS